jgi:hypothetical protein
MKELAGILNMRTRRRELWLSFHKCRIMEPGYMMFRYSHCLSRRALRSHSSLFSSEEEKQPKAS